MQLEFLSRLPVRIMPIANATIKSPKTLHPSNRILVVDDNESLAKITGWTMEAFGYQVQLAHDGASALEKARAFVPDIILLDIGLPKMNGYEVCAALRRDEELSHAVIIAQTGWGDDEHQRRSKEAGFDHHLVKPVDVWELQRLFPEKTP